MNTAGRLLSIYDSLVRKGHNTDVAMMKVWAEVFELQPDDPHLEEDVVTCLQAMCRSCCLLHEKPLPFQQPTCAKLYPN